MKAMIISVGGSKQPIVHSIKYHQPKVIAFLASKESKPLISDTRGSILGELDYLPCYSTYIISDVDSIDCCLEEAKKALNEIRAKFNGKIIVDYTGGTKSMSVALAFLASKEGLDLYFTSGLREDAHKVINGTEISRRNNPWGFFLDEIINQAKAYFEYGLYFVAEKFLSNFEEKISMPEKENLLIKLRCLCRAFDAWDRFDHSQALKILNKFRLEYKKQVIFLESLLGRRRSANGYERAIDLFYNAVRRERVARYDDAVCRFYRAIEMLSELRLHHKYNIESSNVDTSLLSDKSKSFCEKYRNEKNCKIELPLTAQYALLELENDEFGKIYAKRKSELSNYLKFRNYSILAHGDNPVKLEHYRKAKTFAESFISDCLSCEGINLSDFESCCKFELLID